MVSTDISPRTSDCFHTAAGHCFTCSHVHTCVAPQVHMGVVAAGQPCSNAQQRPVGPHVRSGGRAAACARHHARCGWGCERGCDGLCIGDKSQQMSAWACVRIPRTCVFDSSVDESVERCAEGKIGAAGAHVDKEWRTLVTLVACHKCCNECHTVWLIPIMTSEPTLCCSWPARCVQSVSPSCISGRPIRRSGCCS